MKLSYIDLLGDGKRHIVGATITTEHSASSYGQPVIVLDDGAPLELSSWVLLNYRVEQADADELELLQRFFSRLNTNLSMIGRKGGQSTSEAKKRAARQNGKKGGRPKKSK